MSGPMHDERFDATLRDFLVAEAERAAAAAPPVGETLARLGETAGPPSRSSLLPAWLLIVLALLLTAALATSIAVGSGLIKLSREIQPTPSPTEPSPTQPTPQTAISGFDPVNPDLQSSTTYGFALAGSSVGVQFTAPSDGSWVGQTWSSLDDVFVSSIDAGSMGSAGAVGFALPDGVYADPCHRQSGAVGEGPGVDDLIAGLQGSLGGIAGITVDPPRDARIGGMDARELTITFGAAFDASGCDLHSILLWHEPADLEGIPYSHYPWEVLSGARSNARLQSANAPSVDLFVLDVQGTRVLVEVDAPDSANPPGNVADLVDSIRFTDAASEPSSGFPVVTSPSPVPSSGFSGPTPLPGGFLIPQVPTSMWVDPQHRVGLELTVPGPLEWWADTTTDESLLLTRHGFGSPLEVAVPTSTHADACRWQSGGILPLGHTVDELTQALRQSLAKVPGAVVTEPVDATLGTLHARKFTFTVASGVYSSCDSHAIMPMAFPSTVEQLPGLADQFTDELFVVEVHGTLVVVAADVSDVESVTLNQILDSFHWK